jgi:phenylalanyl-tRNA synthetase beta chain
MKVSLNWLNDYVTPGIATEELVHKLTMAGLEVEKTISVKGDTVFEIEITPNRPDCLCMLGIARETAAILRKPKKFPKIQYRLWPKEKCSIAIHDRRGCSRYIGMVIENVSVKKAQEGISRRLEAIGVRSINNVVDVTNYCLMETGQPMHAFDYDKLAGGKIIVRRACKGEKIVTLDNIESELDPSILVIADALRPVAIAGIMGGKDTAVTEKTKNILLESAYFDPILIRRASRKLGLSSDSSYRFERGVDKAMAGRAASRAINMILAEANGKITKCSDIAWPEERKSKRQIILSVAHFNRRAGASLTSDQFKNILAKLDFKVAKSGDGFKIVPPSFRGDIKTDVDIIEEVLRIAGYDNLPLALPKTRIVSVPLDANIKNKRDTRHLFAAQGFSEVITYSMISHKALEQSRQQDMPKTAVLNPLTQDQEILRPSMLPSLLAIVLSNINRGQKNIKFFELGKIYTHKGEKDVLGIIMTGAQSDDWRRPNKDTVDYFDLKGTVVQFFERFDIKKTNVQFHSAQRKYFSAGQGAVINIGASEVGEAGKIEGNVLSAWDIRQENVYFAQIELDNIFEHRLSARKYKPISEYPAICRDISLAVTAGVTAHDIEQSIRNTLKAQDKVVLTELKFVEKYEGDKLPKDTTGLIYSLTYQSHLARTLRDDEVSDVHDRVCADLVNGLGAVQR